MNFDQIINSITLEEFKETLLKGEYEQAKNFTSPQGKVWMQEIEKELSKEVIARDWDENALTNIAYFARAIATMHPGWEEWDKYPRLKKEKEQFKSAVEKLYNQQFSLADEKRLKGTDLLAELYKIAGLLRDYHLEVFATETLENGEIHLFHPIDQKTKLKYRPEIKGGVGRNLAFSKEFRKNDSHTRIFHLETGPLVIAERTINGKKVGIIGLSTCEIQFEKKQAASQRNAFAQINAILQHNLENWDNIILDVRGNWGGIPVYLQQMAEIICGCKKGEKVLYRLEGRRRKTKEEELRTKFYYQPLSQKRYPEKSYSGKTKLLVLTDKETCSSAEFVFPLFRQYKDTLFIGENTRGCCHYGEVSPTALPCGGFIKMGSVFNDFGNGYLMEGTGFTPDINCLGQDALQVAFDTIKKRGGLQKRLATGIDDAGKHLSIFPKWIIPSWLWHRKQTKK